MRVEGALQYQWFFVFVMEVVRYSDLLKCVLFFMYRMFFFWSYSICARSKMSINCREISTQYDMSDHILEYSMTGLTYCDFV